MAQAKGSKSQLMGGIKESVYNADPNSPAGVLLPVISSQIRGDQNMVTSNVIRGRRDQVAPFLGNTNVSGSCVVPVDQIGIGYWLQMLLGDPDTTGANPYTHVFTVQDEIDSWVLEQGYTDIGKYQKFNGCKVNQFQIKAGGDGELSASIDVVGGKETLGDASIDSSPTSLNLSMFNQFQASLKEGGSSMATAQEVELTIKNNLDENGYVIGSGGFRGFLPEGLCQVSGRVKALFEDWTLLNKAVAGTESSLELKFTSDTHSLTFLIEEMLYKRTSPGIEGMGGVWQDLTFEGYFGNGSGDSIVTVTLINAQAAY